MSIDYDAQYGIGFEVMESDSLIESEEAVDGLLDYICDNIKDEVAECFQPGNSFTGDEEGVYLVLKAPFKDGLDLTKSKTILEAEATRLNLDVVGDFGLFGGLRVW